MILPLTSKEVELEPIARRNTFCFINLYKLSKYVALHGVISTLLLPLTIQVIGGQYGVLVYPVKDYSEERHFKSEEIMTFTNVPVAVEAIPIGLLVLVHLLGYISVLKKSGGFIVLYFLARLAEMTLIVFWLISAVEDCIKSHVMSQFALGWYCFFSLVVEFISMCVTLAMACEAYKNKDE